MYGRSYKMTYQIFYDGINQARIIKGEIRKFRFSFLLIHLTNLIELFKYKLSVYNNITYLKYICIYIWYENNLFFKRIIVCTYCLLSGRNTNINEIIVI